MHCGRAVQHFYQNQLKDSLSVTSAPDEPFYQKPLLQPYTFFDVTRGQQARGRGGGGGSLGNQVWLGFIVDRTWGLAWSLLSSKESPLSSPALASYESLVFDLAMVKSWIQTQKEFRGTGDCDTRVKAS